MNTSGDAAEQMVRLSLEGMEVTLRLSGAAAKHVAAMLYAALHNKDRSQMRGKARLVSMMKSGKPLSVFSIRKEELRAFTKEAKGYGILYCMLGSVQGNKDGVCDLLIRAEDAPRINRLLERLQLTAAQHVSVAQENRTTQDREAQGAENPLQGKAEKDPPSVPSSEQQGNKAESIFEAVTKGQKPSIRQELMEIRKEREGAHLKPRRKQRKKARETDGKLI